ncbi:Sec-independent protein translocase subunit TatA [Williamsia muralis]|uniref:Sec-independent protein translocase protein TatA n=1 Tax=Williamsia marianensis TaxID=85044 RepID=A0ABU4EZW9_WILMA|nr:Sec-independent protein translocase subunit TatA [Williamsia muralis]MDV7136795.1 Sec-independent protein translocase subunit TatA [Williamsia muralis]
MNALQPWHIILVVVVFLILFGSKKLPDAARGLGRSMRIFKSEVKEMQNDGKSDTETDDTTAAAVDPRPQITTGSDAPATTSAETERRSA